MSSDANAGGTGGGSAQGSVPQHVLDDLRDNWDLVGRWVGDAGFRRELLDDPRGVVRANNWSLSDETMAWIEERTQARGLSRLASDDPTDVVAF